MSEPKVVSVGFDKVIITVSSPSSRLSSTIPAIVIVPVVSPAVIVNVPLASV